MAGSLIDPIARARTFAARRGGMIDNAKLRKRLTRLERALSPLRNDQDTADDFTTFFDEVDEPPEAGDDTVGRVYLVRNEDADDVLNVGITAEDGTPILVGLSTVGESGQIAFTWTSKIAGLDDISGVAVGPSGNIYTVHDADTLRKYSAVLVQQWSVTLADEMSQVASDGTSVFASAPAADFVVKRLASTGAAGAPSTITTFISNPLGIATDGSYIYVSCRDTSQAKQITVAGVNQGGAVVGDIGIPLGIALDATYYYVITSEGWILKFAKTTHLPGTHIFLGVGNGNGQISDTAEGIGIDSQGRIWIADTGNHRIQVLDATGAFLATFGRFGGGPSQFKSPKQLAISASDVVWIADSGNGRLVTLAEDTGGVTPVITTRSNTSGTVASGASVTVDVTCNAGEVVVGGGHQHVSGNQNINNHESYPLSGTTWRCSSFNGTAGNVATMLTCYARCMTTPIS